jgi:hypothetical protein
MLDALDDHQHKTIIPTAQQRWPVHQRLYWPTMAHRTWLHVQLYQSFRFLLNIVRHHQLNASSHAQHMASSNQRNEDTCASKSKQNFFSNENENAILFRTLRIFS